MEYNQIKTEQKALTINLNESIYGTFAEIGAGQEVARNFFQVGAASSTIAKTMSAYDKTYSDAIYGNEESGRYVCESRLYKMLEHEWSLLDERLSKVKPNTTFFVFADTISALNYTKTNKGQGWLGLRFQLKPNSEPNDIVIHIKMNDNDNKLQQDAIGIVGVNLIYGAFYHYNDIETMVKSLNDGINDRVSIDSINITGPDFKNIDGRLLSLYLVKHGLTEVAIFDSNKMSIHASEFLYKKSLMVIRGHFNPPTLVTLDVLKTSYEQFIHDEKINEDDAVVAAELTLDYLKDSDGTLSESNFLDRTELLCTMGQKVIISNCTNHQMLINYMSDYKINHLGLVIGVNELLEIINEKYYQNQDGRLLVAFGELFTRNIRIYAYPALIDGNLITAKTLPIPSGINFLYKYLLESKQIVEVDNYNEDILHIKSSQVLHDIKNGNDGWQKFLPENLVRLIEEKSLFNHKHITHA